MNTYFPNFSENINRHAYFGEWSIHNQDKALTPKITSSISELYY